MDNVVFDRRELILSATHSFLRFTHTLLWLRSTLGFYGRKGMKHWGTSNQRYHRLVALTSALQDNQDKHWKWRHPSRSITLLTWMGSPKSERTSFCGIIWIVDWSKLILRCYTSLQTCSPAATRCQEIRRWFSCMSLFICKDITKKTHIFDFEQSGFASWLLLEFFPSVSATIWIVDCSKCILRCYTSLQTCLGSPTANIFKKVEC